MGREGRVLVSESSTAALLGPEQGPAATAASSSSSSSSSSRKAPLVLTWSEGIHPRMHYGYVVLGVAACALFFTAAGSTYGVGVFTEALMEDLGVSRTVVSAAWTAALLATGCVLPLSGRLLDRYGARVVMFIIPIPYALALVWLAYTSSAVMTAFAFFFLRWCMGTAMITAFNTTNQWWVRRKGLASTFVNAIGALNITFPTMLTAIIDRVGWRNALLVEAGLIGAVYALLATLSLNRPETYGRLPDGQKPGLARGDAEGGEAEGGEADGGEAGDVLVLPGDGPTDKAAGPPPSGGDDIELDPLEQDREAGADGEVPLVDKPAAGPSSPVVPAAATPTGELHWHWRDAVRTQGFWAVTLSSCLTSLLWSGFNFHANSILTEMGLDVAVVWYMYLPIAFGSVAGMLVAGLLVDRIRVKTRVAALATGFGALSAGLVFAAGTPALAVLFAVPFGFMDGVQAIGNTSIFAYLFGRVHLGRIDAIVGGLSTVFLGLGPTLFGAVRDASGSYTPILVACAVPLVLLTGMLLLTPVPSPPRNNRYLSLHDG